MDKFEEYDPERDHDRTENECNKAAIAEKIKHRIKTRILRSTEFHNHGFTIGILL